MKALLVSTVPPHPTNRGGNQRTALLYRALAELGETDLLCLYPPERLSADERHELETRYRLRWIGTPTEPVERAPWRWLKAAGAPALAARLAHNIVPQRLAYAPHEELATRLRELVADGGHDIVVCRYTRSLALADPPPELPCLLDVDDLDTQKYASRLGQSARSALARRLVGRHLAALEALLPPLLRRAAHTWVTNAEDADTLDALVPGLATSTTVLPNIPYPRDVAADGSMAVDDTGGADAPPVVFAVCSMRMGFNERGVDRFVATLWPRIRDAVPEARFRVAGSMMTEAQKGRWSAVPGVEALGTVDDLADAYRGAAFTITPVGEGGGSKIKVAESLAVGRTCVITGHALRGYETLLEHDRSLLVAEDDDAFVAHCVRLLREPDTRARLAANGRRAVEEHLSERAFRAIVRRDVEATLRACAGACPRS